MTKKGVYRKKPFEYCVHTEKAIRLFSDNLGVFVCDFYGNLLLPEEFVALVEGDWSKYELVYEWSKDWESHERCTPMRSHKKTVFDLYDTHLLWAKDRLNDLIISSKEDLDYIKEHENNE